MLPWMFGRQTLTIVVSSPCMTQAVMTVAVIAGRLATGAAVSPLTARAFVLAHPRAATRTAAIKAERRSSSARNHLQQLVRIVLSQLCDSPPRLRRQKPAPKFAERGQS